MNNVHAYVLAAVLAVVGIGTFTYKWAVLGLPLTSQESLRIWQIETRITFRPTAGPTKLSIPFPRFSGRYELIDQSFVAPGYGLFTSAAGQNPRAVFAQRDAIGEQVLFASFTVRRVPHASELIPVQQEPIRPKIQLVGVQRLVANSVLQAAREESADAQTLILGILKRLRGAAADGRIDALLGGQNSPLANAKAAVKVLGLAGVPARVVNGVRLVPSARNVHFIHWLEVYNDGYWHPYRISSGVPGLPEDYIAWWRGDEAFVQSNMSGAIRTVTTVARAPETTAWSADELGRLVKSGLSKLSLMTLPLDVQQVYRVILTVPLGVLVLVLLRTLVGLTMFGTFMPVLIALAFRETTLLWGLVLFTMVVGAGLIVRAYLEHLKLLMVPRLACIIIVVILLMSLLSILTHKIGADRGLSVALFPLVIITMTIERMSIVWDENGPAESLKQGLGSLAAASLCYFAMTINYVGQLLFVYPELLLILLAITILLGRYSGYRLTEVWRFREFARLRG